MTKSDILHILIAVEEQIDILGAQVRDDDDPKEIMETRKRIANLIECINFTKLADLIESKCDSIVNKRKMAC